MSFGVLAVNDSSMSTKIGLKKANSQVGISLIIRNLGTSQEWKHPDKVFSILYDIPHLFTEDLVYKWLVSSAVDSRVSHHSMVSMITYIDSATFKNPVDRKWK